MNYYNEWDSFAAEWLKQLIKDGLIPDGEVDSRSIADVKPSDLKGFTQCHFFAGIGGWSRALQLAGWSSDRPVWTGSPPCQSFSTAGTRKGKDDERHLWPVFFNLIRECQPPTVFGEQVAAAIRFGWLDDLQIDFEKEGYAAGAFVLPSGSIGAPHKRDRLFFVADSHNKRHERSSGDGRQAQRGSEHSGSISVADSASKRSERFCGGGEKRITEHSKISNILADTGSERWEGSERSWETREQGISKRYSSERSSNSSVGDTNSDRPQSRHETPETAGHRDTSDSASIRAESVGDTQHDGSYGAEIGRSIGSGEDEGRLLESQRSDTADSAGIRAETLGNAEHDGSYCAEIGRSSFEASNSGKEGQDVSCESEGAGRSEIAGDICFWQDSTVIYCRDGKYRPIPTEPALFPLADGIPNRVGILRGAGNAIVPQAAAEIIKAYLYD